jgi:predicted protein tyrosine phosphatase
MKITICGLSELGLHCEAGITHVLSILDPGWPDPEAFIEFAPHHREALRFNDVIGLRPEMVLPDESLIERLLGFGRDVEVAGDLAHLLIHCHAGVSRSTAAATLLLAQENPGRSAADIVTEVGELRPRAWPNLLMLELGEAALGRRGEFVPAVAAQYRRVLEADPGFGHYLRENGRGREVDLAGQLIS